MKLLESSPTVVLIWCHCLVSQYSFKRFYMQYLIHSMQQSTLPIAPSTIYVYLHDYEKDPEYIIGDQKSLGDGKSWKAVFHLTNWVLKTLNP